MKKNIKLQIFKGNESDARNITFLISVNGNREGCCMGLPFSRFLVISWDA